MSIKIVGGKSGYNRICIISQDFASTACYKKDGSIECRIKAHSSLLRYLYRHRYFPGSRLARLILSLAGSMSLEECLPLLIVLIDTWLLCALPKSPINVASQFPYAAYIGYGFSIVFVLWMLAFMRQYIASWHGAEHMAIAAYQHAGSTALTSIERESRINELCGSRLIAPIVILPMISYMLSKAFGLSEVITCLITLEAILWVDMLKKWSEIPIASSCSRMLQEYVTTKKPGKKELLTAQAAIRELLSVHGISQS